MSAPILATKLHIPPPGVAWVTRQRLIDLLNAGLHRKMTLVSAPAGYGKTSLVSAWAGQCGRPIAWLSLDASERDPARFIIYLIAALRAIAPSIGEGVLRALQSGQSPPLEALLAALINELSALTDDGVLVLDDVHLADSPAIDQALAFVIEHLPARLHLVVATREDPNLPLARMRARNQLTEVRITDLRFTRAESAAFLSTRLGAALSADDISALDTRMEGWVAGLQLATLSLQSHPDAPAFIRSFSGTHRFVLDYLVEEVLQRQPNDVQDFLLRTAVLQRMCGPLCDAVLSTAVLSTAVSAAPESSGQEMLMRLERANLFVIPLDGERCWYRYHHLFAELLRQRLSQRLSQHTSLADLQTRASDWFEHNGLDFEAFEYAVAANDINRAARLCEGEGKPMPLHFRGGLAAVLSWLDGLPEAVLDSRPSLRVTHASALLFIGRLPEIEEKLRRAEVALPDDAEDVSTRDLIGRIASIRATLGVSQHDAAMIQTQARRALAYLHPANVPVRASVTWAFGHAQLLKGKHAEATRAFADALTTAEKLHHTMVIILCKGDQGILHENDHQFGDAEVAYRRVIELCGDPALPIACQAHYGLARMAYERDDLATAEREARRGVELSQQLGTTDRVALGEVLLGRIALARGDRADATAQLTRADQAGGQRYADTLPGFAAEYAALALLLGDLNRAVELAHIHKLSLIEAHAALVRGDASSALALAKQHVANALAWGWVDHHFRATLLCALALHASGAVKAAHHALHPALVIGERNGFARSFIDFGAPMSALLMSMADSGECPGYGVRLMRTMGGGTDPAQALATQALATQALATQALVEPLSERELEILGLIAQGLSNQAIAAQLHLALSTVKGHNMRIFGKLQASSRTEALARARELKLL